MSSRYAIRVIKLVFCLSTACFIFFQFQLFVTRMALDENGEPDGSPMAANGAPEISAHDQAERLIKEISKELFGERNLVAPPFAAPNLTLVHTLGPAGPLLANGGGINGSAYEQVPSPPPIPRLSMEEVREWLRQSNARAEIANEHKFGPVTAESAPHVISFVLVVQVHNRPKYLEKLIDSLRNARGIEDALLIFSHDFYSSEINRLVKSIEFCRVMQIFYPYSIQLYPSDFPGQDPNDCPDRISKDKARELNCQNKDYPDKYGHYRVAKITQIKHHWWWKTNFVFDGIRQLKNYSGWMLFLEEDHYVSPDFLHVLTYMTKNKDTLCQECSVIVLGFYLKSYNNYPGTISKLAVYPWFSSRHNMGMAIDRALWNRINECAKNFCSFDDYNWDWSLMHVNLKCLKPRPMSVLYTKAPRVFHIGDCGIHHTGKQCTADSSASKVLEVLNGVKNQLFPTSLEVGERSRRTLKAPKENGGWGDIRDHHLCMNSSLLLSSAPLNRSFAGLIIPMGG